MQGTWIRKPQFDTSVVFVHGVLSSGDACWRHANGTYWPALLIQEKELESVGVYVFTYRTDILALIMASATPFCFCTTQKYLAVKRAISSRA